jgi:hypothetical protein
MISSLALALRRARFGIWTVALTYVLSVTAAAVLVHMGNRFALNYRGNLIGKAWKESTTLHQYGKGNRFTAAALDGAGNAGAGIASMLAGYCPPAGYVVTMMRGWVGGVVAVDDQHRSRLGFYYLTTLLLQLLPYSLVGGAGVSAGIASFSKNSIYTGARVPFLSLPYEAMADAGWICLLSLPLFAIASLFEFLA